MYGKRRGFAKRRVKADQADLPFWLSFLRILLDSLVSGPSSTLRKTNRNDAIMDPKEFSGGHLLASFLSSLSHTRRLEDRIRKLCADAIQCADPAELDRTMERLKSALHDHTIRVRKTVAAHRIRRERRNPAAG